MGGCAEGKGCEHGGGFGETGTAKDGGSVDVSEEEGMYWFIPFAREFALRGRVPPVFIELTIGKAKRTVLLDVWLQLIEGAYHESSAKPLQIHSGKKSSCETESMCMNM